MLDWLLETLFPTRGEVHACDEAGPVWVDPESADGFGLVGIGGDLRPDRLLTAYRHGVFPMYEEGEPICWWSPDPRAIFELDGLHVSRRLARTVRSGGFEVTFDEDFAGVMRGCAERPEGTWITADMLEAYQRLYGLGHAHSVEVWRRGQLVGGVYGVSVGAMFAGESMFFVERDASKVGLVRLFERLRQRGYALFDTQILNDHTATLGAKEVSRGEYLDRLQDALTKPVTFGDE
ncbi:MAG: leucyl/phenylalanyl-tRNA--protein transferase [Gemmataceae bacterium]